MPGMLKRTDNRSGPDFGRSATDENAGLLAEEGPGKRKGVDAVNGGAHLNGAVASTNGVYANGNVADSTMSTENLTAVVGAIAGQLPPEILHITEGYLPLSRLITRLAQDTFNGLNELINEMADMQPAHNNALPHMNGVGLGQASQINVQKKTRMWDFAQDRRAKFIKILVLSQWSRQADLVGKVIDLNCWLSTQKNLYRGAVEWVGELKRQMGPMKLPSPDLKTALEALSTGKAGWLPDLNYLPPEPLTPQQLLKALRTINTLLTIRLNSHENLPPHFKDFSIASGRATFRVEDEFELDVSIADENPSSQLFFIDFRFLFSPCMSEIPNGRIRDEIEVKTNDILAREGLAGCYNFLHDLVLTHKLRVLMSQATEMMRGRWSENLKIEPVHRSLVVQYWLNRPGGKNWVEIGIKRGKPARRLFSTGASIPFIALRWHRHGKEVLDTEILMDLNDLSMESILKDVITFHTNYIFRETKKRLRQFRIYADKLLSLKHKASTTDPTECSLKVQLTASHTVELVQEPVSGAFAIISSSMLHRRMEGELNSLRDPAVEVPSRIANLRCISAIEQTEERARMFGWHILKRYTLTPETVKKYFGADVIRLVLLKPAKWGKNWILVTTTSMRGDSWWVVETTDLAEASNKADLKPGSSEPFRIAFKVSVAAQGSLIVNPTYSVLSDVESVAAAIIAQYTDCRQLAHLGIHYTQHKSAELRSQAQVPDLCLNLQQKDRRDEHENAKSRRINLKWCYDIIKSSFGGLSRSRDCAISVVSGRLRTPIANIDKLTKTMDPSLAFHPTSGLFVFRLSTPVGQSSIPALVERLNRIEHLVQFLGITKRHNLQCEAVSLSKITFMYCFDPISGPLIASISFASDAPMNISFGQSNPHLRIQDFLARLLNTRLGFEYVILVLRHTLSLVRALATIESVERLPGSAVHVLPRSETWYRVRYEKPLLSYEVRLRQRHNQALWFSVAVEEDPNSFNVAGANAAVQAWNRLCQEKGPGWQGMRGGIKAELEGIDKLVLRIDEVFGQLAAAEHTEGGEPVLHKGDNIEKSQEVVALD